MAPLVPPSFVDCCFKRRTKPLLPMVPSLSSRPPSLVGCFRCPPPPTLAASHGRRHQQSVALTAGRRLCRVLPSSSRCRQRSSPSVESSELSQRDSPLSPAILRFLGEGQRTIAVVATAAAVGDDGRSFVRHRRHCPCRDGDSPPLTAVKGVLPASRLPERHNDPPWKIVDLHNINSSGVMAVHLFLFSIGFNSYICFYVGSVCTVLLSCSCDVLEPVTEEQ